MTLSLKGRHKTKPADASFDPHADRGGQMLAKSKANAKKRKKSRAAKRRREMKPPYQMAARPSPRRIRRNSKAERFDVDEGRGWLIVRAQSGRYTQCAAALRSAGCPVFEPRQEVRTIVRGRSRVTHPPMMGRCMFAGVDEPEQACLLLALDYVEAVLCNGAGTWFWADEMAVQGARPAIIKPEMMTRFADHITGHKKADKVVGEFVLMMFSLGERVQIKDGPFASFDGMVEESDRKTGLYKVAVSIFGRSALVELSEEQMEAA